jgi:hypothetical protein
MIEELKQLLTSQIKNTRNLKSLDEKYIKEKLEKYILTYGQSFKKLKLYASKKGLNNIEKNTHFKKIVKEVRDELRIVYGSFLTKDFPKIKDKNLNLSKDKINTYLETHKSTKERINYYQQIYSNIFNWYKPQKIADIACGLNPLTYPLIEKELGYSPKYFASDLSYDDMQFLNNFFKQNNIKGIAKNYDITNLTILEDKTFQDSDLIFLFKALDSFEHVKKNISKTLLGKIPAKKIVISFPTKSLIAKTNFKIEKRNWLFNFINKKNWTYQTFEVENEIFILLEKTQ